MQVTEQNWFAIYRTANELKRRTEREIEAQLSQVEGIGEIRLDIYPDVRNYKTYEVKLQFTIQAPWERRMGETFFSSMEANLSAEGYTFRNRSTHFDITPENLAAVTALYHAVHDAMNGFMEGIAVLAEDEDWIAEMKLEDEAAAAQRKADESLSVLRKACKAKRIEEDQYTVYDGNGTKIGAFVRVDYNCGKYEALESADKKYYADTISEMVHYFAVKAYPKVEVSNA